MYTEPYKITHEETLRGVSNLKMQSPSGSAIEVQVLSSIWSRKRYKQLAIALFGRGAYTSDMQNACKFKYVACGEAYQVSREVIRISLGGLLMTFRPSVKVLSQIQGLMVGDSICIGFFYTVVV